MSALNKDHLGWRYLSEHGDDQRAAVALQCFYLSALAWTSIPLTEWLIRGSLYHLHQHCLWFQGMCKNVLTFLYLPSTAHLPPAPPPRCYLVSKRRLFSWSTNYLFNPQHANFDSLAPLSIFPGKAQSADFTAAIAAAVVVVKAYDTPTHVSLPLLKQASFHSPEAESQEAVKSQQLSTCQSDPQWQAMLPVPTLITQINIKLNTRPCSVNFYAVGNDWLFASLHHRRTLERISERRRPGRETCLCSS